VYDLKISILGSYSDLLDEGMANVSYNVYKNLRSRYKLLSLLNVQNVYSLKFWRDILVIRPNIIHYFPGPTLKGLVLVKLIQLLTGSRSIVSATQPILPKYFKIISSFLKPDIVIVQSNKGENLFKSLNYKTIFIPNGVDTDRFTPVNYEKKVELRKKFGFSERDFIVLHIGPLKSGRNQKSLLQLNNEKIVLVLSTSAGSEEWVYKKLHKANVTIWREFFPDIQEVYAIADVYIFPVFEELNSIEIPLSVLEALACNLPVITTRYGGLNRILQDGEGLFFIDTEEQIPELVSKIKSGNFKINTRKKIQALSWKNIVKDMSNIYEDLYPRQ
jgi:glycosyltransferase involved in cell wall biosynthesis